ncbi:MAG: hypothetical protein KF901_10555 [Myxococcales bacterium]|nr:hypothetical protein [Myxococcales bacterium]
MTTGELEGGHASWAASSKKPTETSASATAASARVVHAWNALRVVAMFDIASFHLTHRYFLGGIGLPVFLLLSTGLTVMGPRVAPRATMLRRRLARLTGPWAFWTLVLSGVHVVRALRDGLPPFGWFEVEMLLEGVETHFWYLPFVTVAGWLLYEVDRVTRGLPPVAIAGASLVVALLATSADGAFVYHDPFSQWAFALPSLPLGLGLGVLVRCRRQTLAVAYVAAFGVGAASLQATGFATGDAAVRFGAAASVLVGLWLLPNRELPLVRRVEPLMLGIFLLHVTVGYVLLDHWIPHGTIPAVPYVALVVVLTGAGVWVMRRTPLRRFL